MKNLKSGKCGFQKDMGVVVFPPHSLRVEGEGCQGVKPSGSRVTASQDGKVPEGRDFCLLCKQM